jgi:hypothetical protein
LRRESKNANKAHSGLARCASEGCGDSALPQTELATPALLRSAPTLARRGPHRTLAARDAHPDDDMGWLAAAMVRTADQQLAQHGLVHPCNVGPAGQPPVARCAAAHRAQFNLYSATARATLPRTAAL